MLSEASKKIYKSTYYIQGEDHEAWLDRMSIARLNSDIDKFPLETKELLTRVRSYIKNQWFHPATPISANLGTNRGLPISCFVREVGDSRESIFYTYNEGNWMGSEGAGIATNWSLVRSVGEKIAKGIKGETSGIIPFLKISDSASLAISQGSTRRASEAAYLDISHPEIKEFINIRKPSGNVDINRHCPNLHHAVIITDKFMNAMLKRETWDLISPMDGSVIDTVDAFELFMSILDVRTRFKGEPYLFFIDNANKNKPELYKIADANISMSNLCCEIALHTTPTKSNVCCLGSLNLEKYDEYKNNINQVVSDCLWYLDEILDRFVERIKGVTNTQNAYHRTLKGVLEDRPLGLGVMGFHSYLQSKMIPFDSLAAKDFNDTAFSAINKAVKFYEINNSKEPCGLARKFGMYNRNVCHTAIAPTMSISMLCNFTSQGVEPLMSNYYSKKVKQGSILIKNPYLDKYLSNFYDEFVSKDISKSEWLKEQWKCIADNEGSVKALSFMSDNIKDVFKTAFEIDQKALIRLASYRQKFIDQGQSINLFFTPDTPVKEIYEAHILAYELGLNSLYYQRSLATSRVINSNERKSINTKACALDDPDCEACQ